MTDRTLIEIRPHGREWRMWIGLLRNGRQVFLVPMPGEGWAYQRRPIELAMKRCNYEWTVNKQPCELRIRRRNGTYAPARTYGRDPKGSKG